MLIYRHRTNESDAAAAEVVGALATLLGKNNRKGKIIWLASVVSREKKMRRCCVDADGVRCVWYIPDGVPIDRAVLYLRGGELGRGCAQAMDYYRVRIS